MKYIVHEIKSTKDNFNEVFMGHKNFEIIKKSKDKFELGNKIILKEYDNNKLTGNELARTITHIVEDVVGIEKGYVIVEIQ